MSQNSPNLLYNISLINDAAHGDPVIILSMIKVFINSTRKSSSVLFASAQERNWELMKGTAHKLKTNIDLLEIHSIKMEIRQIEKFDNYSLTEEEIRNLVLQVREVLLKVENHLIKSFSLSGI